MAALLAYLLVALVVDATAYNIFAPAAHNIIARPRPQQRAPGPPPLMMQIDTAGTVTLDIDARSEGSSLLDKLESMEGIWYSDDFYGPHGREWVEVSATLVGAGTSSLVAVKVSGDANVPSGYKTWRTKGLPDEGGPSVPCEIQVRANVNDPNGFSWVPGALVLVSEDKIALSAFWSAFTSTGTFYKHKVGEGA